jgi:UDP-N-acetylmuramate--alanine ligase
MTVTRAWSDRRLHFVGVGGCGMSGLALAANARGALVSGSDMHEGPFLDRLRQRGVRVDIGHAEANVPNDAEIVVSSAIPFDNVERRRGRERQLREQRRGDFLVELTRGRRCIAVAGTHGKTTTAAMIVHGLRGAGERVDYVIGGDLLSTGVNAEWDDGDWLVIETDESDRSVVALVPEVAVLTNVEWDHVEEFESLQEVEEVFREFLGGCDTAIVWDRPEVRSLRRGPVVTFDAPSPTLGPAGSHFAWRGHNVELCVPGAHNARNAAAALEACVAAGADPGLSAKSLADFPGVARRFEHLGNTPHGATLYDDYAHHPTEVRATLSAARTLRPRRLVAVMRPWGAARTRMMATAYGEALALADLVVVLDVAGTAPGAAEIGADSRLIVDAVTTVAPDRPVRGISDPQAVGTFLGPVLGPGTVCVTLGCGDVAAHLLARTAPVPSGPGGA